MSIPETPIVFAYSGAVVTYVVQQTGEYIITSEGAQGGTGEGNVYGTNPSSGGLGAQVEGEFSLVQGETLEIAVGGQGSAPSSFEGSYHVGAGGGGGGSYVVLIDGSSQTVLEVAGGGGGGGFSEGANSSGGAGGLAPTGLGLGGASAAGGGGGAGLYGDGATDADPQGDEYAATGGADLASGLTAGNQAYQLGSQLFSGGAGGFGGGGGGSISDAGGGGGGYDGGSSGEGGTSYVNADAIDTLLTAGVADGNGDVTISLECFAEGTRIDTPSGPINVENLCPGSLVISGLRGVAVEVRWVGHRHITCTRHSDPSKVFPVRIRAGAFGSGLPLRDLLLSPDHAVFIAGVLIPVKFLVNGLSIAQEPVIEITYWHIEVDGHDVILAEGLPVESYLDAGARSSFVGRPMNALAPDFASRVWEAQGCAPLRVTGPEVDAVRARLERFQADWR